MTDVLLRPAFQFRDPIQIFVQTKVTIFETFLVILLALASRWAHIFWERRDRYCNKLLSSLAKFDVLSWFLGGNQFDAFVGGFEIR